MNAVKPGTEFGLSISQEPTIASSGSSTASQIEGKSWKDKDKKRNRKATKNEINNGKVEEEGLNEKKGEVKHTETE